MILLDQLAMAKEVPHWFQARGRLQDPLGIPYIILDMFLPE